MSKNEIEHIVGGFRLPFDMRDADGEKAIDVVYSGNGVLITPYFAMSGSRFMGAILRTLYGEPLRFANLDPFPADDPDCTQQKSTGDKTPDEAQALKLLASLRKEGEALSTVALRIVESQGKQTADTRLAAAGVEPAQAASAKKSKKKEKTEEAPAAADNSFQQTMQQVDKDRATIKTSLGEVEVGAVLDLLTKPPLDPEAGPLSMREKGMYRSSVMTRLWYGYDIASLQREAAKKPGFDAKSWRSVQPETPLINHKSGKDLVDHGIDDFVLICKTIHELHPGAVPAISVRFDAENGEAMFRESVEKVLVPLSAKM